MADLLKRLSAEAQKYATAGPPHIRDLLLEAEVEIERLQRELADARVARNSCAEVLVAAVQYIQAYHREYGGLPGLDGLTLIGRMQSAASAALSGAVAAHPSPTTAVADQDGGGVSDNPGRAVERQEPNPDYVPQIGPAHCRKT